MSLPTLLDIAKQNGSDALVGLIEEVQKTLPEISGNYLGKKLPGVGAARTIKGTSYKTLIRTSVPRGGFRGANEGVTSGKSGWENRNVETFILNSKWKCDKAVADAHEDGAEKYIAVEGAGVLLGSFITLAEQFYYGRSSDAKGHPGIIDSIDSSMVVDATGSTADTGSSVYAVKFGPSDVQWVYGKDGSINLSDLREQDVTDPNDATKTFTAYLQEILAWVGVQVASKYSVARVKNLTAQTGKGLTDNLLYDLLDTFPSGMVPDVLFMSRRSRGQLRKSRTATNATGSPAPMPMEFEGIPIATSDAIKNTEAIV